MSRTGGKEHDKAGNVKVYNRTHVTNDDGDLDDVFVAKGYVSDMKMPDANNYNY